MSTQNTFGTPITDPDRATAAEKAYEAMNDGRNLQAQKYLQDEAARFGNGIKALGLIYNATGKPLTVGDSVDWHGQMYNPYPVVILNGQWGAFVHTKTPGAAIGSESAVIYHGKTAENDDDFYVVMAHDVPFIGVNQAYTAIGKKGAVPSWDDIKTELEQSGTSKSATYEGILSATSIDVGTTVYFRTVLAYTAATKEFKTA